jgi:hypothetical protein
MAIDGDVRRRIFRSLVLAVVVFAIGCLVGLVTR